MRPLTPLALALLAAPLAAQAPAAPSRVEAAYVVRQDGKETGRERLLVRPAQGAGGRVGERWELDARRLTGDELRGVLSQSGDGHMDALLLEVRNLEGTSTLRAAHRGKRIIITMSGDRIRRSRELPGGGDHVVLLDPQLHALLFIVKDLATEEGVALTGVYPRTGDRVTFTATRRLAQGGVREIVLAGGLAGRLVLGADGRVDRLELASGVLMERLPA